MPDHEGPSTAADESGTTPDPEAEPIEEADPTFADGTARQIDDTSQPLTRDEEGLDR